MASSEVWRRVVFIRWKASASRGEIARAMNVHKSFPRTIPCVLSVAEGMTCTSMVDGGGCYPGVAKSQQNRECLFIFSWECVHLSSFFAIPPRPLLSLSLSLLRDVLTLCLLSDVRVGDGKRVVD